MFRLDQKSTRSSESNRLGRRRLGFETCETRRLTAADLLHAGVACGATQGRDQTAAIVASPTAGAQSRGSFGHMSNGSANDQAIIAILIGL